MNAIQRIAVAALVLLLAPAAFAKTVTMEVNGMVCAFCAQGIEKRLRAMAPTQDVFVSLAHKVVAVALKDGQDIPDAALVTSMKEAGYDVTSIRRVDAPLSEVRKAVKGK